MKKIRELVKYFSRDFTVLESDLTNLHHNTVSRYVKKIRRNIAKHCENNFSLFIGEIECDESYFGGKKKGDKRGRGVTNNEFKFFIEFKL